MAIQTETLEIRVRYKDDGASSSIQSLRKDIEAIDQASRGQGFQHLTQVANSMTALGQAASGLNNIGPQFQQVAQSAENLFNTFKSFNPQSYSSNISALTSALSKVGSAIGGLNQAASALERLSKLASNKNTGQNLQNMAQQIVTFANNVTSNISDEVLNRFERLGTAMAGLSSGAGKGFNVSSMTGSTRMATKAFSDLGDKMKKVISLGWQLGKMPFKMILSPLQSIGNGLQGMTAKFTSFLSGIGRIALYRAIRTGIKLVTSSVKEGVNNLYIWAGMVGNDFKPTMDSLATSFLYLKNSIGAAVSPLLTALAPALETVVNQVVDVLNIFNQAIAAFTGASTWRKAIRSPADYSDNISNLGHEAQDATDAVKELKRTILGFDEINKLEDKTTTTSPKTNGKDATGLYANQGAFSFEEVQVSNSIKDWIDKLKKAWENGDFTSIGNAIASKIGTALLSVNWDKDIKPVAEKVAKSLGTFLNGLLDYNGEGGKLLWDGIAYTIYNGINTAVLAYTTFFDTVHWEGIGNGIGAALRNVCENINWTGESPNLADALAAFPNAVIDTFTGFNEEFTYDDFASLGNHIGSTVSLALTKINWKGLFGNAVTLATNVLGGIKSALIGFDWKGVKDAILNGIKAVPAKSWKDLGKEISGTIIAVAGFGVNLLDTVTTFLATGIDWKSIKSGIIKGITDVPDDTWSDMGRKIGNTIFNIVKFGASLVDVLLSALQKIKWGDLVGGIWEGIDKKVKDEYGGWAEAAAELGKRIGKNLKAIELILAFAIGSFAFKALSASFASSVMTKIGLLQVPGKGISLGAWVKGLSLAAGIVMSIETVRCIIDSGSITKGDVKERVGNALNTVTRGMTAGALVGFGLAGFTGGVYGMILGAAITLSIKSLYDTAKECGVTSVDFLTKLAADIVGLAIGFIAGGPVGAAIGLTLATVLTLSIKELIPEVDPEAGSGSQFQFGNGSFAGTEWTQPSNAGAAGPVAETSDRVGAADTKTKLKIQAVVDTSNSNDWWTAIQKAWAKLTKNNQVSKFLTEGVANKATDWWTNVQTWWQTVITGKLGKSFTIGGVDNQAGTWWEKVKSYWRNKISGQKADPFHIQGVVKQADAWWTSVKTWWSTEISGKNASPFSIQGVINAAATWWGSVKTNWSNEISGKTASSFKIDGVKDESSSWKKDVFKWWKDLVTDPYNTASAFTIDGVKDKSSKWWKDVKSYWKTATTGQSLSASVEIGNAYTAFVNAYNSMQTNFNNNTLTAYVNVVEKSSEVGGQITGALAQGGVYKNGQWHDITAFASGGFPSGEMFIAREAGPELVGTIGGNTAVMNNDQIVASVSAGVAQAVASVMGNANGQPIEVTVKVDSETLYRTVRKGERKASGRYGTAIAIG